MERKPKAKRGRVQGSKMYAHTSLKPFKRKCNRRYLDPRNVFWECGRTHTCIYFQAVNFLDMEYDLPQNSRSEPSVLVHLCPQMHAWMAADKFGVQEGRMLLHASFFFFAFLWIFLAATSLRRKKYNVQLYMYICTGTNQYNLSIIRGFF